MADEHHHEIIIIKRHGDHDEGHHGGAWKIALADFMTAMMALFLVLWLIGSTTKETKTAIAEYFNPVKLAETTFDRKGLRDPQNKPGEAPSKEAVPEEGEAKGEGKGEGKGAAIGSRAREAALFQDPYAVLARLAAEPEPGPEVASADAVASESGEPGIRGGETARDPFDPLYWQVSALAKARTDKAGATGTVALPSSQSRPDARAATPAAKEVVKVASADDGEGILLPNPPVIPPVAPIAPASAEPAAPLLRNAPPAPAKEAKAGKTGIDAKAAAEAKEIQAAKQADDEAETAAAAEIKAEIARVLPGQSSAAAPHAEVRRTGEGILISLTDEVSFSMFGVGSAEPQAKVVRALEQVARILKDRPGRIVVRGHTDGRPFRSETYDNWRLSSARAQMASYMLVRGGLPDARIERIEGYADRQPRNGLDPKAAENRRIEILLRGRPE